MKPKKSISLISKVRELANEFIISQLKENGEAGLFPSHGEILFALYSSDGKLPMKEIAHKINRTQPTVTVLIDKLLELDFLKKEKSNEDARYTLISLTEKGKAFRDIFFDISLSLNEKMHSGFSEEEADILEKMLGRIIKNFE